MSRRLAKGWPGPDLCLGRSGQARADPTASTEWYAQAIPAAETAYEAYLKERR